RGRPLGLANAPSSRERSCRIGCTRMTWSSTDSCTEPATMVTSMLARAQARPARYGVPAKQTVPPVVLDPLHVRRDQHLVVQDLDQPAGHDDLDMLAGVRRPGPIGGPGQADQPP